MRSSVATRYQLGLIRHAGSVTARSRASTPQGTCESAMNCGEAGGHVGGERLGELVLSRNRKPSTGRQDRGNGRAGRRVGDQGADRLALVGCERGDVDERGDLVVGAGLGDHDAAVGVADEHDRPGLLVEHVRRGGDVAGRATSLGSGRR